METTSNPITYPNNVVDKVVKQCFTNPMRKFRKREFVNLLGYCETTLNIHVNSWNLQQAGITVESDPCDRRAMIFFFDPRLAFTTEQKLSDVMEKLASANLVISKIKTTLSVLSRSELRGIARKSNVKRGRNKMDTLNHLCGA